MFEIVMRPLFVSLAGLFLVSSAWAQDEFDPKTPVTELTITTDKMTFAYDIKEFTVKAGSKVKLTLVVPEDAVPQPHNLILVKPDKEPVIVQLAMQMMADPTALERGYVPDSPDVLAASKLINPGETDVMELEIPTETGVYPYICTFPGHFMIMKGKMNVVE